MQIPVPVLCISDVCMYTQIMQSIHLHTCIHMYVCMYIFVRRVVPHRTAASLAASPPTPPHPSRFQLPKNQRHALMHEDTLGGSSPGWGAAGMGGVCVPTVGRLLGLNLPAPGPYNSLRRPRVTNTSRLVVNGALRVASGEMER